MSTGSRWERKEIEGRESNAVIIRTAEERKRKGTQEKTLSVMRHKTIQEELCEILYTEHLQIIRSLPDSIKHETICKA